MRRVAALDGLRELHDMFESDRARLRFLERMRWPEGFSCARCGASREPERPRAGMCVCVRCGFFRAVVADSMFRDQRISLERWFSLFWMLASGSLPLSAPTVMRLLEVTALHAAAIVDQLGDVLALSEEQKLHGLVELDAGVLAIGDIHQIIVVAVERHDEAFGRIRMRHETTMDPTAMRCFLHDAVAPTSTLRTDCWSAYLDVKDLPYIHEPVAVPPPDAGGLQGPAVALRLLRHYSRVRRPASRDDLKSHIDAFVVRFNRASRASNGELFCHLIGTAFTLAERARNVRRRISGVRRRDELVGDVDSESDRDRGAAG